MAAPTAPAPDEAPRTGRVLVVDDEEGIRTFLAESIERDGHDVVQAAHGGEGLELAREQPFDVVLTDLQMPVLDGMALVRALRTEQPDVEVVILTAHGDVGTAVEAMKLGAFDYVEKPVSSPAAVRALVARALARRAQMTEGKPSGRSPLPGGAALHAPAARSTPSSRLSFGAPSMKGPVDAIAKVAKTNATVLLLGESGTGKELAARAIHAESPRAGAPFVAINCAVLTENLLESELFGHEKGAFTGAHEQRRGRIELADGGTFFLDEVGELHPGLQAKLLRVLEERRFERLGGSKVLSADVRWIAATHRDLRAMARAGTFREDLYHRLAAFPIRLPPLRDRPEDVVPLATLLLEQLCATAGRPVPALDAHAARRVALQPWPGNVRELKNAIERALILADGGALGEEHFAFDGDDAPASTDGRPSLVSLEDMEKHAIERALTAVSGNRKAAAERLGIGLRTLYEKLKRYNLK